MNDKDIELRLHEAAELCEMFSDNIDQFIDNLIDVDPDLSIAMMSVNENIPISEIIVKRVDSKGNISRIKDRETRKRLAYQTTGLSNAKRRLIARKAAKTRKANPTIVVRAMRKKKRAEKRRKAMGL